ncbi:hypothetical protein MAJ_03444, partial [Metarhizium majus ARSEF 297]
MPNPLQLYNPHRDLLHPPENQLTQMQGRPPIVRRLRQQHRTHVKVVVLHRRPITRIRGQKPHRRHGPSRRLVPEKHTKRSGIINQRVHLARPRHGQLEPRQASGIGHLGKGYAHARHDDIPSRRVDNLLDAQIQKRHSYDAPDAFVLGGSVVREHAAGRQRPFVGLRDLLGLFRVTVMETWW